MDTPGPENFDLDPDGIPTAEVRRNLAELLGRVAYGKERVVVTRHGKGVAALVPVEDLDLLNRLRRFAQRRQADEAVRQAGSGETVTWQQLRRELGL